MKFIPARWASKVASCLQAAAAEKRGTLGILFGKVGRNRNAIPIEPSDPSPSDPSDDNADSDDTNNWNEGIFKKLSENIDWKCYIMIIIQIKENNSHQIFLHNSPSSQSV